MTEGEREDGPEQEAAWIPEQTVRRGPGTGEAGDRDWGAAVLRVMSCLY